MEVWYQLRHKIRSGGVGHTEDISNRGVFFKTKEVLPIDTPIDITMHWPTLLECDVPLKLVVHGEVVRSDPAGTAVKFSQYEFKTRRVLSPSTDHTAIE